VVADANGVTGRSAQGDRDTRRGKLLTVCAGEVRAFSGVDGSFKVVAFMQATVVNVQH
jgi:hypothetical protein